MKKFVFIFILFFIFAFQTKAQLSYVLSHNDRTVYVADHGRSANYSGRRYNNYSATSYKGYSNNGLPYNYSNEYYQEAVFYIDALYKAHSSDKSADIPKQEKVISSAEARRIEFSENK